MFFYQISTLTADIDIINSTTNTTGKPAADVRPGAGDDEFIAGTSGTAATLNPGDQLDGLGGTDTLKVYGNDSVANLTAATIKNIEIVQAIGTGNSSTATDVNVSANADVKEVWLVKAANANTVTATTAQTVGVEGKATGTQTVTYSGAADGAADAATIMLKGANTSAVTIAPTGTDVVTIEKLTLEATGKNVLGTLTDATLTDLVIKGTGSVEAIVDSGTATLKTISASANKGGVDLTLTTGDLVAAGTTITGGSGDDTISFTADAKAVKFAVDLGAGDDSFTVHTGVAAGSSIKGGEGTDTLVLKGTAATINTTADKIFDGFENIKLDGTSTYHVDDIKGITGYEIGGTTAAGTITNLADNATVTMSEGATSAELTLAKPAPSSSAVTVVLDNGATAAAAGVVLTGLETNAHVVNVVSDGLTSATQNQFTATGTSLTGVINYMITGDQAFTLNAGAAKVLELVDASKLNVKASDNGLKLAVDDAANDAVMTIEGSAGKDSVAIVATAGDDKYTFFGNGGADKVAFTASDANDLLTISQEATAMSDASLKGASVSVAKALDGATALATNSKVVVDFSTEVAALLKVGGVTLGDISGSALNTSFTGKGSVLDEDAKFAANSNINLGVSSTAGKLAIQIDVDRNGVFNAASDYQVTIVGSAVANTIGYDAGTGDFTFAVV